MDSDVTLELTKAEALVLFEYLNQIDKQATSFLNEAQQKVLSAIECQLEKLLLELFDSRYAELLKQAEQSVLQQ